MGPDSPDAGEAGLDEAVAALGVVPFDDRDELKPIEVLGEVPGDLTTEIALPDVEDEADRAVHVRRHEGAGVRFEIVEVAVGAGRHGRVHARRGTAAGRHRRRADPCRPRRPRTCGRRQARGAPSRRAARRGRSRAATARTGWAPVDRGGSGCRRVESAAAVGAGRERAHERTVRLGRPPEILGERVAVEVAWIGVAGVARPLAEVRGDGGARDVGEIPVAQLVLAEAFAFRRSSRRAASRVRRGMLGSCPEGGLGSLPVAWCARRRSPARRRRRVSGEEVAHRLQHGHGVTRFWSTRPAGSQRSSAASSASGRPLARPCARRGAIAAVGEEGSLRLATRARRVASAMTPSVDGAGQRAPDVDHRLGCAAIAALRRPVHDGHLVVVLEGVVVDPGKRPSR